MADAVHRFVVTLPHVSGLPGDSVVNVLHCGQNGVLGINDVADAAQEIQGFYTATSGAMSGTVGSRLSESLSRAANACTIEAYASLDLSGATPFGSPNLTVPFTLPASDGNNPLPEEVATVLSYHGDLTDVPAEVGLTRPAQRRRGRMFIGPLNNSTGADLGTTYRPIASWRTDCTIAFETMAEQIKLTDSLTLGVWSKADAEVWDAVGGWMDDAWDTQRRRGVPPTTRTLFTIS